MTAKELETKFYGLFEELHDNPILLNNQSYDAPQADKWFLQQLKSPRHWAEVSTVLKALYTRNITGFENNHIALSSKEQGNDAYWGVSCGDKSILNKTFEKVVEVYKEITTKHKWAGSWSGAYLNAVCAQWNTDLGAKERYHGDFRVKTRSPMLIIGNRYDPITPLVSAKNLTNTFQDSVLLEQNGYGHCSTAQKSACTKKVIKAYLLEGKLPKAGTVCEVDDVPFKTDWDALDEDDPEDDDDSGDEDD